MLSTFGGCHLGVMRFTGKLLDQKPYGRSLQDNSLITVFLYHCLLQAWRLGTGSVSSAYKRRQFGYYVPHPRLLELRGWSPNLHLMSSARLLLITNSLALSDGSGRLRGDDIDDLRRALMPRDRRPNKLNAFDMTRHCPVFAVSFIPP